MDNLRAMLGAVTGRGGADDGTSTNSDVDAVIIRSDENVVAAADM